jgi:hypothetical protein
MARARAGGEPQQPRSLLIANGTAADVRESLQHCTQYELWAEICEHSDVLVGNPAVASASAKRALYLDRMLVQAGQPPIFCTLNEDERLAMGNVVSRALRTTLPPEDHAAVIAGRSGSTNSASPTRSSASWRRRRSACR